MRNLLGSGEMSSLQKPVPIWSLLLVSLALGASPVAGFTVGAQLTGLMGLKPRGFSLPSRTSQMSICQGSSSSATISLSSVNGFTGSLGVTETMSLNATGWVSATPKLSLWELARQ